MALTSYERETIINYNQGEDTASVYTYDPRLVNRMTKLAQERPNECKPLKVGEIENYGEWIVPKSWITVRPPMKRNLTDEQKATAVERLRAAREAKKQN